MGYCKKDVTPLLTHWSYVFLALTHWFAVELCSPHPCHQWPSSSKSMVNTIHWSLLINQSTQMYLNVNICCCRELTRDFRTLNREIKDLERQVKAEVQRVAESKAARTRWDRVGCWWLNTLRLRQHGRHFADDTFKCIFLNGNVRISMKLPLKFDPQGPCNNIPALVQIMAWRRPGDKPLSEPLLVSLLMHICATRSQWVNYYSYYIDWWLRYLL